MTATTDTRVRTRAAGAALLLVLVGMLMLGFSGDAYAAHSCDDPATTTVVEKCTTTDEANHAISVAANDGKSLITTNIPVLLAVTGVWVALAFGRRLVKKVMGS